jgi:hypothetical protein
MPQGGGIRGRGICVGVEGIYAVIFGGDEHDVVPGASLRRSSTHGYAGQVQRLSVDVAVHGMREELSELTKINVRESEDGLSGVRAGTRNVVVLCNHAYLRGSSPAK